MSEKKLEDMNFCVVCGEPCWPGDPPLHEGECRDEWWRERHPEDCYPQERGEE